MRISCHSGRLCASVLAILIAAPGCGPTITSSRLSLEASPGKEVGVVYRLTTPQFTVTTTPASEASPVPKYTLQLENMPDPSERWGVHVAPGFLSEIDVTVALTGDGGLSSLTEASREQLTPTIKAVGDFTGSVVGAAALTAGTIAALDATPADAKRLDAGYFEACELLTRFNKVASDTADANVKQAATDYAAALAKLGAKAAPFAELGAERTPVIKEEDLAKTMRATSQTQFDTLALASVPDGGRVKAADNAFQAGLNSFVTPYQGAVRTEADYVKGEVEYATARKNLAQLSLFSTRTLAPDIDPKLRGDAMRLETSSRQLTGLAMHSVVASSTFANILGGAAGEKTPAQRAVAKAAAEREAIAELQAQFLLLVDPKQRSAKQDEIDLHEQVYYSQIGASDEYAEIVKLRELVKNGPPITGLGIASPMQEYATSRAQLASLEDAATKKLAALVTAATPKAAPKPAEWDPKPLDRAFVYNPQREKMQGTPPAPARLLRLPSDPSHGVDPTVTAIGDRVRSTYGASPERWPNFVVVIDKVKP